MGNSHSPCVNHTTYLSVILSEPNLDKDGLLYLMAKIMDAGSKTKLVSIFFYEGTASYTLLILTNII